VDTYNSVIVILAFVSVIIKEVTDISVVWLQLVTPLHWSCQPTTGIAADRLIGAPYSFTGPVFSVLTLSRS